MKTLLLTIALVAFSASAQAENLYEIIGTKSANEGRFSDAGFSFVSMSNDPAVHMGNVDVALLTYNSVDYFRASTMVPDFNFIFDLGEMSCADLKSEYPEMRTTEPLTWLAYTTAGRMMSNLREVPTLVQARINHCYLVYNNDDEGRVVALFSVKYHRPGKSVIIGEVEVLDVIRRK